MTSTIAIINNQKIQKIQTEIFEKLLFILELITLLNFRIEEIMPTLFNDISITKSRY